MALKALHLEKFTILNNLGDRLLESSDGIFNVTDKYQNTSANDNGEVVRRQIISNSHR
jgi:hypothetical protein